MINPNDITTAAQALTRVLEAAPHSQEEQDAQADAGEALTFVLAAGDSLGMEFGPRVRGLAR